MRLRYGTFGILVVAGGCALDSSEGFDNARSVARDSAGVEIIEMSGEPEVSWEVASEPEVEIGAVTGEAAFLLSGVRSTSRLSDGTIVIADSGTREIRFFNSDGSFSHAVSGQGSGPGEYVGLVEFHRMRGDSLVVLDSGSRRITILDSSGGYVRDWSLSSIPNIEARAPILGVSDEGALLSRRSVTGSADATGYVRESWDFFLVPNPTEGMIFLPGQYGGVEYAQIDQQQSGGRVQRTLRTLPYTRTTLTAVSPSGVFVASTDGYDVREYAFDGTLRRIVRKVDAVPVGVSDAAIEAYLEGMLESVRGQVGEEQAQTMAEERRALPRVATVPVLSQIMSDGAGYLWVSLRDYPWLNETGRWEVVDTDGALVAQVEMPPDLRVHQIGQDYVLGVATDAMGIERVQLYGLER